MSLKSVGGGEEKAESPPPEFSKGRLKAEVAQGTAPRSDPAFRKSVAADGLAARPGRLSSHPCCKPAR